MPSKQKSAEFIRNIVEGKERDLQRNEELQQYFTATKEVSDLVAFDDNNELFKVITGGFINKKYEIYRYDQIVSFELLDNGEKVTGSGMIGAGVGAVLFGGAGAVVGAVVGSGKSACDSLQIKITLRDSNNPLVYIPFLKTKTNRNSILYKQAFKWAQETLSVLQVIIDKQDSKEVNLNGAFSEAEEILKFKQLMEMGIISEEEFEEKKRQLLGL